jgi:23S rRNA pseudouridine955/2504/2580 synthase/23S rRNA pseudouridine1911/1915/1917 synthase
MVRDVALEILYETPRLVAVNKPAGLAAIPGRAETDCLLHRLARQLALSASGSADPRLRVVHRLDKETSGVMLFVKDVEAQRHLSHQFQNNQAAKQYLAIVAGRPDAPGGDIDAPLAVHPASPARMTVSPAHGKPARTRWVLEEALGSFSLLRVFPQTGKTHQIRVHLCHIGLPLAVDSLYNPTSPGVFLSAIKRGYRPGDAPERPLIDRLTLHAEKLRFADLENTPVEVTAPLPKDFRATLNMLRKYARR